MSCVYTASAGALFLHTRLLVEYYYRSIYHDPIPPALSLDRREPSSMFLKLLILFIQNTLNIGGYNF